MKPRVVVSGASGQVGLFSIALLLASGYRVVALTRGDTDLHDSGVPGLDVCGVQSFVQQQGSAPSSHDASGQTLLSCGPAEVALRLIMAGQESPASWNRVVLVGTTSTETKRQSSVAAEREAVTQIRATIEKVKSVCAEAEVPCVVLKPTLIYGCGMDANLSRVYRFILQTGFAPLARCAQGKRQPIHVADLATTLVRAVEAESVATMESPVCGGSTISYLEMIRALFDVAKRPERLLRVPRFVFPFLSVPSRLIPGMRSVNGEMFNRQASDQVFDDRVARDALGHAPRPYNPVEADFRLPPDIVVIREQFIRTAS